MPTSWNSCPEAKGATPREPVGQRLLQELRELPGQIAREPREIPLDRKPLLEHRKGVTENVEVVVRVLDHASQSLQLGQDDRRQGEIVHQPESAEGVRPVDDPAKLGELALARRIRGAA